MSGRECPLQKRVKSEFHGFVHLIHESRNAITSGKGIPDHRIQLFLIINTVSTRKTGNDRYFLIYTPASSFQDTVRQVLGDIRYL